MGTLLLLSNFNLSTKLNWDLMDKITGGKVMSNQRFNDIIKNLRGFEMSIRQPNKTNKFQWCDQKDKLQFIHYIEEKMFEHCRQIFFQKGNSGLYVVDDELKSSKAADL